MALNPLRFYKTGTLVTVANVNNTWMAMGEGWHYTLYVRLIPLLVVIPYAITYYTDNKKGIVKNYYSRTKKINYILAKYIAVFLTGGTAAVLPLMLNLFATSAVIPSFIAITDTIPCNANGMWSYILFTHPYIYYLLYLFYSLYVQVCWRQCPWLYLCMLIMHLLYYCFQVCCANFLMLF